MSPASRDANDITYIFLGVATSSMIQQQCHDKAELFRYWHFAP